MKNPKQKANSLTIEYVLIHTKWQNFPPIQFQIFLAILVVVLYIPTFSKNELPDNF